MANPEHLKILKKGVKVWNKWRKENPEISMDLSHADLGDFVLNQANFKRANLEGVFLTGADLRRANLEGANLSRTNLSLAYFMYTNLINANLGGALLYGSAFIRSNLRGTMLSGARIYGTIFGDVDLSSAIGLNSVSFAGPSTVGIDTIYCIWR